LTLPEPRGRYAFTLIELLIVMGIIAILMVLVAPAFTNLKSAGDVTGAAYTIKGVLDQARTYAMANNTYTWVGFYEEDVSTASTNPATTGTGRVVMSIVASTDGTTIYTSPLTGSVTLDPTTLIQVGKLTKINNVHLQTFPDATATPPPDTFATRPLVGSIASSSPSPTPDQTARIGDTTPPSPVAPLYLSRFQYPVGSSSLSAQYMFTKIVQFSPLGEARIDNNSYSLKTAIEVGIKPSHGTTPDSSSPSPSGVNPVAIQLTGVGGNVKIYRR